jgi:hypothetical protein
MAAVPTSEVGVTLAPLNDPRWFGSTLMDLRKTYRHFAVLFLYNVIQQQNFHSIFEFSFLFYVSIINKPLELRM